MPVIWFKIHGCIAVDLQLRCGFAAGLQFDNEYYEEGMNSRLQKINASVRNVFKRLNCCTDMLRLRAFRKPVCAWFMFIVMSAAMAGLEAAVRAGDTWYSRALNGVKDGLARCKQEVAL